MSATDYERIAPECVDLWDNMENVIKWVDDEATATQDFMNFVNAHAALEKQYSQSLRKLCQDTVLFMNKRAKKSVATGGTINTAFASVIDMAELLADQHNIIFSHLEQNLLPTIADIDKKTTNVQGINVKSYRRINRELTDISNALEAAKQEYHKAGNVAKSDKAKADKVLAKGNSEVAAGKGADKARKSLEKTIAADSAYQLAIANYNEFHTEYFSTRQPELMTQMKEAEEERIRYVALALKDYIDNVLPISNVLADKCEAVGGVIRKVNPTKDWGVFVEAHLSGLPLPPIAYYQSHSFHSKIVVKNVTEQSEADAAALAMPKKAEHLVERRTERLSSLGLASSSEELTPVETSEGWLLKRGDGVVKSWKKRYFKLQGTRLYYYKTDNDADPISYISLGRVSSILPAKDNIHAKKKYRGLGFQLTTEKRVYYLVAEDEGSKQFWLDKLQEAKDTHYVSHRMTVTGNDVELLVRARAESQAAEEYDGSGSGAPTPAPAWASAARANNYLGDDGVESEVDDDDDDDSDEGFSEADDLLSPASTDGGVGKGWDAGSEDGGEGAGSTPAAATTATGTTEKASKGESGSPREATSPPNELPPMPPGASLPALPPGAAATDTATATTTADTTPADAGSGGGVGENGSVVEADVGEGGGEGGEEGGSVGVLADSPPEYEYDVKESPPNYEADSGDDEGAAAAADGDGDGAGVEGVDGVGEGGGEGGVNGDVGGIVETSPAAVVDSSAGEEDAAVAAGSEGAGTEGGQSGPASPASAASPATPTSPTSPTTPTSSGSASVKKEKPALKPRPLSFIGVPKATDGDVNRARAATVQPQSSVDGSGVQQRRASASTSPVTTPTAQASPDTAPLPMSAVGSTYMVDREPMPLREMAPPPPPARAFDDDYSEGDDEIADVVEA